MKPLTTVAFGEIRPRSRLRFDWMVDVAEGAMKVVPGLLFVDPYTMGLLVKCNTGALDCSASASG